MDTIFADQIYFIIAGATLFFLSFAIFFICVIVRSYYNQRIIVVTNMNERLLEISV